ncbi:AAA family ATPase [Apibacter muscae]|uniref:AAA family ATPase n=1 Tax=Apibacter muscae TaxID=2509004 RepID=UPI0035D40EB1
MKTLNERATSINDIKLVGSIKFYYNRFKNNFSDFFNQKSNELREFNLLSDRDNNYLPDVNFDEHLNEIKKILDLILEGKVTYRKYKEAKDSVKALFKDEFFDYWELSIGNDEIANMSPGKANLALLKLLIELSESNCPILIDQPEDNLDNRSIYTDLVQFIRKRKENRQIIIVTHNPNIVVGADSENVIIANQNGQDKNRENKSFRFEYVNGALENTYANKNENVESGVLFSMGIRENVTEILEGGREAFKKREEKYGF